LVFGLGTAAGMYGYVIGNVANLLANMDVAKTQFTEKMEKINTFMKFRNIPRDLQDRIHNYYAYSNGIFLLAAVSWGIVGLLEGRKWRKVLGIVVLLFCVFNSIERYYDDLYQTQRNNATHLDNLASEIRNVTQPKDVVLIFSQDWSSEIPYYSERRTLIWPRWMEQDMDAPSLREAISRLGDNKIGAIGFCDGAQRNTHMIERAIDSMKISRIPNYEDPLCAVYPSSGVRAEK